jgi:hypothetical protein
MINEHRSGIFDHDIFNPILLWRFLRRGSPLPIPNREVKPACADGTWPKARESMAMPILQ